MVRQRRVGVEILQTRGSDNWSFLGLTPQKRRSGDRVSLALALALSLSFFAFEYTSIHLYAWYGSVGLVLRS